MFGYFCIFCFALFCFGLLSCFLSVCLFFFVVLALSFVVKLNVLATLVQIQALSKHVWYLSIG